MSPPQVPVRSALPSIVIQEEEAIQTSAALAQDAPALLEVIGGDGGDEVSEHRGRINDVKAIILVGELVVRGFDLPLWIVQRIIYISKFEIEILKFFVHVFLP